MNIKELPFSIATPRFNTYLLARRVLFVAVAVNQVYDIISDIMVAIGE